MANKYGEEIYSKALLEVKAALTGHQAGQGSEFLPTETANEIINLVYDRNWARQAFQSINLRRETLKIPKLTGSITFHGRTLADADGTEASESRHTSSEITLTIKTLIANVPIGNRVVAYGVEGLLPVIRSDLATRLAFIEEACFVNGDETVSNAYADNLNGAWHTTDNTAGVNLTNNTHLLQFNGLRKLRSATDVAGGGANLSLAMIRQAITNLGLHGTDRTQLILLIGKETEADLLGWTELQTVDKYGPQATIHTGEIGKIYGITVISTVQIPTNLDATGVVPAAHNGLLTCAMLLHKASPMIGNPSVQTRAFSVGYEDEPKKDRFCLIPREDIAFNVRYPDALCLIENLTY